MKSLKQLGEWGIALLPSKKWFFWQRSLLVKLMLINLLVIAIVIWLAGVSVKDFACLLNKQYQVIGGVPSNLFDRPLQFYLIRASVLAVIVAGILYYFLVRKLTLPLQYLGTSAQKMARGEFLPCRPISSKDEVGRLISDFNYLSTKLQQTEKLRKKVVSDIAHELRTPLTNLTGYLEALNTGVIQGNPELYRSLHEEALHLTGLVEELHQLNIWESKRLGWNELQTIPVENILVSTLKIFELEFHQRHLNVESNIQAANILGNKEGLKQVITNLLKNVLKYDRGGWVKIEGEIENSFYKVVVTNWGQPIPEDKADQVFERFYRLDSSRNRKTGGVGLGLAIVKEIIDQHRGAVGLISREDEHSFWFTVPLANGQEEN
ncbi:signal transduction histidine kinase [Desulfosporosinus acidiphilus SJ4]|uniref:histidine kinase n=1 Tax=Desulfosporosinus acidiphilus (strain DSM 22704 / JCM 16185 / SJ4) TaxID=646529 RepID=I4DAM1_DESAJ|nr:signal transduction histidine kinase [Desulfosporosinus acidiphilus SJ4]